MTPRVGEQLGHYQILAKAGEGGMGVVYRAHDTRLGRDVALKFFTHLDGIDANEAARMRAEARSLAALSHANIVRIYDLGEADDAPYLVLEWVPGTPLSHSTHAATLGEAEFLRIAQPIAEALSAAHIRNLVHRDLKPANVMIADDGSVKLLDFGLARFRDAQLRLTRTAAVMGTPSYMSPEQATGADAGPASDIFSFGVLAYELLTGATPFQGPSVPAILYSIVHAPHVPLAERRPDLPVQLCSVIDRCLAKAPEDRFPNGSQLALELQRAQHALSGVMTIAAPAALRPAGCPEIRYCTTRDGASIAYSVHGSGPVIVRALGWFTHLEMEWQWPALRLMWERLGQTHTVVRYDGRGIGLSAPWDQPFTEETRHLDMEAVLDTLGAERAILYGISEGGFSSAHYTAAHPGRISHLIIYGGYSRGARFRPDYDPEEIAAVHTLIRKGWGRDSAEYRQMFTTTYFGQDCDPGLVAHYNALQRAAADGDTAARYLTSLHERGDGTEVMKTIRTPTLVIHCRDDQVSKFAEGQRIAQLIPGAQFLPLPSGTHYFPIEDGTTRTIVDAIARFTRPS